MLKNRATEQQAKGMLFQQSGKTESAGVDT
jgi:hypothetical protein